MNSIVNLYKPAGPTSFAMVRSVKQALQVRKAGHIGTLDPMAEGVLPICLDRSTRIIQFLTRLGKVYRAEMALGAATDTQDATGRVLATGPADHITENNLISIFQRFTGKLAQVPPMFSAKKKNGVPLYKLARDGITINREPVPVEVYSIDFLGKTGNRASFRVHCSAGTYIRTLCHDIGAELGCGAHLTGLVREGVGGFDLASAVSLEDLKQALDNGTLGEKLLPADQALEFLPELRLKPDRAQFIAHGAAVTRDAVLSAPEKFFPGMTLRATLEDGSIAAIVEPVVDQEQYKNLQPQAIAFKLKRVLV